MLKITADNPYDPDDPNKPSAPELRGGEAEQDIRVITIEVRSGCYGTDHEQMPEDNHNHPHLRTQRVRPVSASLRETPSVTRSSRTCDMFHRTETRSASSRLRRGEPQRPCGVRGR